MIDRWTDAFFWPALSGSWIGAIVLILALPSPAAIGPAIVPVTGALLSMAGAMFVVVLVDTPTRRAIQNFNSLTAKSLKKSGLFHQLFSSAYGDPRLLIVNRLVWIGFAGALLIGRQDLALMGLGSFATSGLMLMLGLKRRYPARTNGS